MSVVILLLALSFGFSCKFADLLDEHGLKWFKHADILFGFIWGLLGSLLVLSNVAIASQMCATLLYWVFRRKLDYKNHALGGSMVLLSSVYVAEKSLINFNIVIFLFLWFVFSGIINTYLKQNYQTKKNLMKFLRLRLRLYLMPLIVFIFIKDINFLLFNLGVFGATEITTYMYSKMKLQANSLPIMKALNLRYINIS